jgi:hypothetical protein
MPTTTMPREGLIERLVQRRTEVEAEFAGAVTDIEAELERRETAVSDTEEWAKYHDEMAAGFRDGSITLSRTGRPRASHRGNMPAKPGVRSTVRSKGDRAENLRWYNADGLRQQIENIKRYEAEVVAPINAAIDLLNLATGETVEVDLDSYSPLLTPGRTRGLY